MIYASPNTNKICYFILPEGIRGTATTVKKRLPYGSFFDRLPFGRLVLRLRTLSGSLLGKASL